MEDLAKIHKFKDILNRFQENFMLIKSLDKNEILTKCTGYLQNIGGNLQKFNEPDICTRLRLGLPLT